MRKIYLFLICIATGFEAFANTTPLEDSLRRELAHARSLPARLKWMHELAEYYFAINKDSADAYARQIVAVADSSRDRSLMVRAYLYNADRCFNFVAIQEYINRGIADAKKALEIARAANLDEYVAWSYIYLARGSRSNGESDKALNYNSLALSLSANVDSDSLKVYAWISLGTTHLARDEKLLAFRNYLSALSLAEETRNANLQERCYNDLVLFYRTVGDYEKAKDFAFRIEAIQRKQRRLYDLSKTYNNIGHLYAYAKQYELAQSFHEKSIALADTLNFDLLKIDAYVNIVNLYLFSNQYHKALEYYNAHPQVHQFLSISGLGYFQDQAYGAMYTFLGKLDSAGYYYSKAEPEFEKQSSRYNRYFFYNNISYYHRKREDYDKAIGYQLKAMQVSEQTKSLELMQIAANNLDSLYRMKGDFRNALYYNGLYHRYKDSLEQLSEEKDLMLLELDNENKRKEREAQRLFAETQRRHNIQYMGITVAIVAIFILLVISGVFSVSKTTIRILGFFAFIFLFEFIILLADQKIHHWTHGEPWKVLAIKIGLIAILLPLHHWLEKKVIHYLTTQQLLRVQGKGFLGKWFRKKRDVPVTNA